MKNTAIDKIFELPGVREIRHGLCKYLYEKMFPVKQKSQDVESESSCSSSSDDNGIEAEGLSGNDVYYSDVCLPEENDDTNIVCRSKTSDEENGNDANRCDCRDDAKNTNILDYKMRNKERGFAHTASMKDSIQGRFKSRLFRMTKTDAKLIAVILAILRDHSSDGVLELSADQLEKIIKAKAHKVFCGLYVDLNRAISDELRSYPGTFENIYHRVQLLIREGVRKDLLPGQLYGEGRDKGRWYGVRDIPSVEIEFCKVNIKEKDELEKLIKSILNPKRTDLRDILDEDSAQKEKDASEKATTSIPNPKRTGQQGSTQNEIISIAELMPNGSIDGSLMRDLFKYFHKKLQEIDKGKYGENCIFTIHSFVRWLFHHYSFASIAQSISFNEAEGYIASETCSGVEDWLPSIVENFLDELKNEIEKSANSDKKRKIRELSTLVLDVNKIPKDEIGRLLKVSPPTVNKACNSLKKKFSICLSSSLEIAVPKDYKSVSIPADVFNAVLEEHPVRPYVPDNILTEIDVARRYEAVSAAISKHRPVHVQQKGTKEIGFYYGAPGIRISCIGSDYGIARPELLNTCKELMEELQGTPDSFERFLQKDAAAPDPLFLLLDFFHGCLAHRGSNSFFVGDFVSWMLSCTSLKPYILKIALEDGHTYTSLKEFDELNLSQKEPNAAISALKHQIVRRCIVMERRFTCGWLMDSAPPRWCYGPERQFYKLMSLEDIRSFEKPEFDFKLLKMELSGKTCLASLLENFLSQVRASSDGTNAVFIDDFVKWLGRSCNLSRVLGKIADTPEKIVTNLIHIRLMSDRSFFCGRTQETKKTPSRLYYGQGGKLSLKPMSSDDIGRLSPPELLSFEKLRNELYDIEEKTLLEGLFENFLGQAFDRATETSSVLICDFVKWLGESRPLSELLPDDVPKDIPDAVEGKLVGIVVKLLSGKSSFSCVRISKANSSFWICGPRLQLRPKVLTPEEISNLPLPQDFSGEEQEQQAVDSTDSPLKRLIKYFRDEVLKEETGKEAANAVDISDFISWLDAHRRSALLEVGRDKPITLRELDIWKSAEEILKDAAYDILFPVVCRKIIDERGSNCRWAEDGRLLYCSLGVRDGRKEYDPLSDDPVELKSKNCKEVAGLMDDSYPFVLLSCLMRKSWRGSLNKLFDCFSRNVAKTCGTTAFRLSSFTAWLECKGLLDKAVGEKREGKSEEAAKHIKGFILEMIKRYRSCCNELYVPDGCSKEPRELTPDELQAIDVPEGISSISLLQELADMAASPSSLGSPCVQLSILADYYYQEILKLTAPVEAGCRGAQPSHFYIKDFTRWLMSTPCPSSSAPAEEQDPQCPEGAKPSAQSGEGSEA